MKQFNCLNSSTFLLALSLAAIAHAETPSAAIRPIPELIDGVYGKVAERELPPALRSLAQHQGRYRMSSNNASNQCRGMDTLGPDDSFALVLRKARSKNEFAGKGDVTMFLRRYYPNWAAEGLPSDSSEKGQWYRTFDRADFFGIGNWSLPSISLMMFISGKTRYDNKTKTLTQTTKLTGLTGRNEESVQSIRFNDADSSFTYTYDIIDHDTFGRVTQTLKAGECTFKKVPEAAALATSVDAKVESDASARRTVADQPALSKASLNPTARAL